MKKKLITALTSVCLLLALVIPANAAVSDTGFSDVASNAWYAEAIAYCQQHGIMSGTSADTFAPEETLTRAMLAAVLYRMTGSPPVTDTTAFKDVSAGAWYSGAVSWAAENNVISGYGRGIFGVNDPTTREQAVTILWRYAGNPESSAADNFSDAASVSDWAKAAVRWANTNGILDGMMENHHFNPEMNIERGEVASMLYHYLNLTASGQELPRQDEELFENKIDISFNGHTYSAALADNSSAKAFADLLKNGPLTISAHDYGSFEKVGELGTTLPRNDEQITTSAGDIILYQGNQITIYYAQNTWSFTRLGRMDDPSGLQEALGSGDVDLTFALAKE